jgi:hypothetical protein
MYVKEKSDMELMFYNFLLVSRSKLFHNIHESQILK